MRKHILLGAVPVLGLFMAALAPLAAQSPDVRGSAPQGGPAVVAPGPAESDPAVGRGQRRGGPHGGFARRQGGGPAEGRGVARGRIAESLNLSADQKAAIENLRLQSRDEIAPLVDRLRLARRELHRAVFADKSDPDGTKKLSSEVATLGRQIAEKRLGTQTAVAALLTAEQRTRVRAGGTVDGRASRRRPGPMNGSGPASHGPLSMMAR